MEWFWLIQGLVWRWQERKSGWLNNYCCVLWLCGLQIGNEKHKQKFPIFSMFYSTSLTNVHFYDKFNYTMKVVNMMKYNESFNHNKPSLYLSPFTSHEKLCTSSVKLRIVAWFELEYKFYWFVLLRFRESFACAYGWSRNCQDVLWKRLRIGEKAWVILAPF